MKYLLDRKIRLTSFVWMKQGERLIDCVASFNLNSREVRKLIQMKLVERLCQQLN